jgi:hypothetical protein
MARKTRIEKSPIVVGKRRVCDACPKRYIPVTKTHRFHNAACRVTYHRLGDSINLLQDRIAREVTLQGPELLYTVWRAADDAMRRRFPTDLRREFEQREEDGAL